MKVVLTVASDAESERLLRAHFKFGVGIFRFTVESPNCFARRTRRKTPKALYTNSATGPREFWRTALGARRLRRFTTHCPAPFFHPKPRVCGSGVSVALRVRERSVRAFPKRSSGLRNLRACLKSGWHGLPARLRRQLAAEAPGGLVARRNRPVACSHPKPSFITHCQPTSAQVQASTAH